ncbi:sensor histidine kinase KdpD [Bifidobacterium sp. 82T24]|uniref:sensor histidine kinase n=1 Tax=Bifidobacterium pluvialisilvae TaxID=2834436 RepID=UPI001C561AB6|nr:ATP-binding protein [Bifidobacterium pluvialisilvae]MBW3088628.1 sensor histidine kinase KdpD [Bifidobacterium pluvialisilvae]
MAKARGSFRVLLGAAPGVGKTCAMLKEGHRLKASGKDVVIALIESHGRKATETAARGLEIVPRRRVRYRGMWMDDMDLFKVIERHPDVALVDELAHTNIPGSVHEKRWQDVEDLLAAGIDVITTINVQHIESLNDVVREITGSTQKETVPDKVLRSATQVELVDLPPAMLRERLSAGLVYKSDRVDAALSNYFRVGNLTALRELALLWLAGRVDEALKEYRDEHNIRAKWETRERVVVALSGGPEGDQLLRRGARVARASGGGDLIAVHVTAEDGLAGSNPTLLARQRRLVEQLGGTYHQIVGEDIPDALLDFARANNATQVIVGVSRRGLLARWLGRPSATTGIVDKSGDIDVHIVTHEFVQHGFHLPKYRESMAVSRKIVGVLFSLVAVLTVSWLLFTFSTPHSGQRDALILQLIVVLAAVIGGVIPATVAAVLSGLALDFLYTPPVGTFHVIRASDVVTIVLYVIVGVIVGAVVDRADARARQAQRARAESEMLASVAGSVLRSNNPLRAIVHRTREAFGFDCVRVVQDGRVVISDADPSSSVNSLPVGASPASAGDSAGDAGDADTGGNGIEHDSISLNDHGPSLELYGRAIEASDQRMLMAILSQIQTVLEHNDLMRKASEVEPLAAAEKVRTALLNAVSHDLRRPLASATTAVSGLQRMGSAASDRDRRELLDVADNGLKQLTKLVTDLLDVSRIREGALPLALVATDVGGAIVPLFDELDIGPWKVDLDIAPGLPLVVADPALLQRALSNVVVNAMRFTPDDKRVRIAASTFNGIVEIRIVDQGPGVPDDRKSEIFVPFHRLGDTDNTTGLGLGMALSKGFVESMGGSISAEDTPGGGLTIVIALRVADPSLAAGQPIPKAERPNPAEILEQDTLNVSGAVSDVILPLPGEGPSEERGLDRFINYTINRGGKDDDDDDDNDDDSGDGADDGGSDVGGGVGQDHDDDHLDVGHADADRVDARSSDGNTVEPVKGESQ